MELDIFNIFETMDEESNEVEETTQTEPIEIEIDSASNETKEAEKDSFLDMISSNEEPEEAEKEEETQKNIEEEVKEESEVSDKAVTDEVEETEEEVEETEEVKNEEVPDTDEEESEEPEIEEVEEVEDSKEPEANEKIESEEEIENILEVEDRKTYVIDNFLNGKALDKASLEGLVMDDLKSILNVFGTEFLTSQRKAELIDLILNDCGIIIEEEIVAKEEVKQEEMKIDEDKVEKAVSEIKATSKEIESKTIAERTVPIEIEDKIIVDIPITDVSYEKAINLLRPSFVDEQWIEYKNSIDAKLGEIIIEDDMNPGTLKYVISKLSELRQEIWYNYQQTKTLYETLGSKEPEGLIERVKKIAYNPADRNDMERKRTGIKACLEYVSPGTNTSINLFEVLDETRERYNFLKTVMDSISYKTNSLITMNGALKLEKSHLE